MAYDIYGNNLRSGYCEVHPHVPQEYPCAICYSDSQRLSRNREQENLQRQDYELRQANERIKYLDDELQKQKLSYEKTYNDQCVRIDKLNEEIERLRSKLSNYAYELGIAKGQIRVLSTLSTTGSDTNK
jgi:hypothetical protein